jgi:drug/metabolite transporter (DMT)-like permease
MLGLAASVCWGVGDFVGGAQTKLLPGIVVVLASQAVGLVALAIVVLPAGAALPAADLGAAGVAGVATSLGITAFYKALSIGPMSVVAPISATGVIVPVVVGIADGDRPASLQVAGMAVAIVGVLLASQVSDEDPDRRRAQRRGIVLAVLAAGLIGISLSAFARAGESAPVTAVMWARAASVTTLGVVALLAHPDATGAGKQVPALVAIGLLDVGGTVLFTTASGRGLLSLVAVAASLYPISTILLARGLLGERLRVLQAAGVISALAGVAAVAAG